MIAIPKPNPSMQVRIHRGCREIGGNCVEIESAGRRIVLDLGLPLSEVPPTDLPDIRGLETGDDSLLGVFISHPHPDHYGLLERIDRSVPVYMGAAAARIVDVGSFFTPLPGLGHCLPSPLVDGRPIRLGPFTVTPFRVDHSGFDSYCLLVEAGGRRLLYTGDLRGHGHNPQRFEQLVTSPPDSIDVLICEGTQVARIPDFAVDSEDGVIRELQNIIGQTDGLVMVWCSSQNIDRLVSVWQAAQQTGRQLIVDLYTAEVMRAAEHSELPAMTGGEVQVYLPASQKQRIIRERAFDRVKPYYPFRIYPEHLAAAGSSSVMICRPGMLPELQRAGCFDGAAFVSSLWAGYVRRSREQLEILKGSGAKQAMLVQLPKREAGTAVAAGVRRHHIHTSGHATLAQLRRLVAAFPGSRIVPIHLDSPDAFARLASNVELKNDLEWWEV